MPADFADRLAALVAAGRRADAVKEFMTTGVALPGLMVALMRLMPAWSRLKALAHTLPYDGALLGGNITGKPLPVDGWRGGAMPRLVVAGGKSPQWMQNAMHALAGVLPNAEHQTLAGQTHIVKAKALAPALGNFFAS